MQFPLINSVNLTKMICSVVIIGLILIWTVNAGDDCSNQLRVSKHCKCNLIGELGVNSIVTIYCSYSDSEYVHIKKFDDNDVRYDYTSIHCMGHNIGDRSMNEIIPSAELGAENTVKLDLDCPLANTTIRNYLDRLGITSVKNLHLIFVGEFGPSSKIKKSIFAGASSIRTLNLVEKNIRSLPSDVFEHLTNLRIIDLSDNKFNSLDSATFSKNKKLKKLTFDRNSQRLALPSGLLSDLPLLKNVSFKFSHIKSVPGNLFSGSENMTSITLAMNQLETIPPALFHSQTRLINLNLGGNDIRTLPANLFKTNVELKKLDLYANQLTSLPADLFENNKKLKKINLGGNNIQVIPDNLFKSLEQLTALDLSRNQIQHLTAGKLHQLLSG